MNKQNLSMLVVAGFACVIFAGCQDAIGVGVSSEEIIDAIDGEPEAQEKQSATSSAKTTDAKQTDKKVASSATSKDKSKQQKVSIATFGNGCYWCTESVFQQFDGIYSVVSGFSGGKRKDVTYREVCTGTTGHAEVVQVRYNPSKVTYKQLLQAFFLTHDPTTKNRQGADIGPQYRSAIFFHDKDQERLAKKAIKDLNAARAFKRPIVTEVTKFGFMVPAPKYHQDYFIKNPGDRYCLYNIPSKVAKVRKVFKNLVKDPAKKK